MDLDGDAIDDVISGSYWPGDLFWFKGLGGAKYAKGEKIKGADGKDLNTGGPWKSQQDPDLDSLATAPFAADLDGDGDLDLLVGNIAGHVILVRNDGTAKEPKFAVKGRIQADGSDLTVPGGDAGPTLFDWDGDGDLDLIVGAGDGSVWLYTNRGTKTKPDFARGEILVAGSANHGAPASDSNLSEPKGPGSRAKVCVTDWNGDGRPDLLVGDFHSRPALQGRSEYHGWVWLFVRKAKSVSGG